MLRHENCKFEVMTEKNVSVSKHAVKALLSPLGGGAYLISDPPDGGLIERGLIRERGLNHKIK